MGTLLIVSLAGVAWSARSFVREQRLSREIGAVIERLNRDIDMLTARLDAASATNVLARLRDEHAALVLTPESVVAWAERVQSEALPFVLDVEPTVGGIVEMPGAEGMSVVPVTFTLTPAAGVEATASSYQRMLQFCRTLSYHTNRVDLVDLSATAGTNSVDRAVAVVHLWSEKARANP
jgi:hypothetical protein